MDKEKGSGRNILTRTEALLLGKSIFPHELKFKYPWRSYQQKVLEQLDELLFNRHFHLVAPPGSGKTVVGLEVVRRLNEPTLILAPTLTIKNQWIERLVTLFMDTTTDRAGVPEWISDDLRRPRLLTVTTYQALHSLAMHNRVKDSVGRKTGRSDSFDADFSDEREELAGENLLDDEQPAAETDELLQEPLEEPDGEQQKESPEAPRNSSAGQGACDVLTTIEDVLGTGKFKTLVLDEAHHLRSEWWRSTMELKEKLGNHNLVALTATPPYDVAPAEWKNYIELCGPIDLEISVPELVREGDLCPHQDYVYLSVPSLEEKQQIGQFQQNVREVKEHLLVDESFRRWVETHRWVVDPESHVEEILGQPEYFSSMIIYLKTIGSQRWESLLPILGAKPKAMPELDAEWLEKLLVGALFQDRFSIDKEEHGQALKKWLQRIGALERRRVYLQSNRQLDRMLVHSVSKLDSIKEIVAFEQQTMAERLRLVVLTDYIRLVDLPKHQEDIHPLTRIGVVPIFEVLRRNQSDHRLKLAVLSGSLVILPKTTLSALQRMNDESAERTSFTYTALEHDDRYVLIRLQGRTNSLVVQWVTDLFAAGHIHVLVGTTALLGEGWDAPCINSLVLASYVGSFMLSNQMRGRAIRAEQGNPGKTSTIWHLVCTEPALHAQAKHMDNDLETLSRRFKTFVGLSNREEIIESGLERLDLPPPPYTQTHIDGASRKMLTMAAQRGQLKKRWEQAIYKEERQRMVEEVRVEEKALSRTFLWMNTIRAVLYQALLSGVIVFSQLVGTLEGMYRAPVRVILIILAVAAAIGILVALPGTVRAVYLLLRNGTVESNMKNVGEALLHTYSTMSLINTKSKPVTVQTERDPNGYAYCWLEGATTYEQTLFLDSLQELLGPIENPRYLLIRKSKLGLLKSKDYHAVPQWIGRHKDHASVFAEQWNKRLGEAELVFTRNLEGRRLLLNARMNSLSASFISKAERLTAWR